MAALGKQQQQPADTQQSSLFLSTAQPPASGGAASPPVSDHQRRELSPTSPLAGPLDLTLDRAATTSSDSNDGMRPSMRASSGRRAAVDAGRVSRGSSPLGGPRGDEAPVSPEHGYLTPPRGSSPDRADVRSRRSVLLPPPDEDAAGIADARCHAARAKLRAVRAHGELYTGSARS